MATAFKLVSIVMGFAFPAFFIKAIRAKGESEASRYTTLSAVSFGLIVLTILLLLPNY